MKLHFDKSFTRFFSWSGNFLRKSASPPHLSLRFLKNWTKTFIKTQLYCVFREKIISFVIKIYFFKNFAKKIAFALLLNRKSCICCHKHCRAYFRRHMECAVLKRFLKVQGTFAIKKFLANPTFPFGKN